LVGAEVTAAVLEEPMVEAWAEAVRVAANELDAATKVAKITTAIVEARTLDVRGLAAIARP
jgi:hypothetical protein